MNTIKKSIISFVLTLCLLMSFPVASGVVSIPANIGVIEAQAASVKLNKTKLTLIKGQTYTLKVSGTKKKVKWSSSKKSVATVTTKGKVTAKKKGTVTISAKVSGKTYKCKITVETPSISKTKATLAIGKTTTLSIKNTKQKVTWKSSNKKIATVDSKGKVKGIKTGSVTITATVGSLKKKYTCKIKVDTKKGIEFSKVKSAIDKYGETEINGSKCISYYYVDSYDNDNYYVIYYEDNTVFLSLYTEYKEVDASIITVGLPKNSDIADVLFYYYEDAENDYEDCEATAIINAKKWNKNDVDFTIDPASYDELDINLLANENLVFMMDDMKELLDSYGISINNLGFNAFK